MLSLVTLKELLGEEAADLPLEEVERIRELEYTFADALFENWLIHRKQLLEKEAVTVYNDEVHNNPTGFFVPEFSGAERG